MSEKIDSYAKKLWEAETSRIPIQSFSGEFENELGAAYQIQCVNADRRLREGEKLLGYKIGLTSREAQKHFGITHPDFGHLFESMAIRSDGQIFLEELIQPKIEGEIAFLLGRDLHGPRVTLDEATQSIEGAAAAFEVIDSRFEKWKISAFDTVADNGSSARFVISQKTVPLSQLDLAHLGMALSKNNEVLITACGAAVMGNPILAMVFLVNELAKFDRYLKKGQWVLSGSLGGMLSLEKNTKYTAEFLHLGKILVGT